jgi:hypothetical protein
MLDTHTGEVVNRTLLHEGEATKCGSFIASFHARCWWVSRRIKAFTSERMSVP